MNRGSKDFLPHQILSHKGVGKKGKGGTNSENLGELERSQNSSVEGGLRATLSHHCHSISVLSSLSFVKKSNVKLASVFFNLVKRKKAKV